MKLSEVRGERVFDVIADLIEHIGNIAADPVAADLFTRKKVPDGMTAKAFVLQRVRENAPALLKGHKKDVIAILSAIEGESAADYTASLNLVKLTQDFTELLTDDAFRELFISAQSETDSGSARETTEAPGA